jgi:integrase/recombinase XerC
MPSIDAAPEADVVSSPQGHDLDMIAAYLEHLRRAGRTDDTIRDRREVLHRFNRAMKRGIGGADDKEIGAWLYRDDWKQNTKAAYYMALKSFYGWATRPHDLWLQGNPMVYLEPVKTVRGIPRPVTDDELRRVLTESAEPIRTWAKLAAYQGLRCIEISRLDREHITERTLIVVKGKGGKPRAHDTDPYVWAAVKDLPPGPIARTPSGGRATPFEVSATAALHFRRQLKMPGVSLHRLRHWLGVTTQRIYKDIRVTQAVLGHESLSSTQVYTDATGEQQRQARAMLPRLAG